MRSQGQVRFIKISSTFQKALAAGAVVLLAIWAISLATMAWSKYQAEADRLSLLERQAEVQTASDRVTAYRDDLEAVGEDLDRRMGFLEQMVDAIPDDVKGDETVSDSSTEAAETVEKVSASLPEAATLVQVEARQLAYVERLTRFADQRARRAELALRELGLDPSRMLVTAERGAKGGPLELLATSSDGSIDPRFERLGLSLARMDALERSLKGIPHVTPTDLSQTKVSSGFGYRRDPFTGGGAMHKGLDFKGPYGSDIFAASTGTVAFSGWKSGYGKTVEISHGNGIMTRYAHLSRNTAKVGEPVEAGDVIGALGSTGRSTGPHLHFEVRINDRAVNPRKFLEAAPNVLKEARRTNPSSPATR
ncbi:MAG: M23 family metallopeptidase [Pseudomonadota bacterium]